MAAQLSQQRMGAILHLAGQMDLEINALSEEMDSLTIRLESLRALASQLFSVGDGTLSNEEVRALIQASDTDANSPEHILEEIIEGSIRHSPE